MKYHVLIGTHHKTGTVWMLDIFRQAARTIGFPFLDLGLGLARANADGDEAKPFWDLLDLHAGKQCIAFASQSRFPLLRSRKAEFRGLHVTRDPRDVLISAARYHSRADEPWLVTPMDDFGGLTYQQKINQCVSFDEKIRFEAVHSGRSAIRDMHNFDTQEIFINVKYEDLINDVQLTKWRKIFAELGFEDNEISACLEAVWKHSLFGAKKREGSGHISNGSSRQWVNVMPSDLLEYVNETFAAEIRDLGYLE